MANIKNVAKLAGVSPITVSRTIRQPDLVKESTKLKVQEAIKKLGYVPDYFASTLKSTKSHRIGVVIHDVENPFFGRVIKHLDRNLQKFNYSTIVAFSDEINTTDFEIYSSLKSLKVEAILFTPTIIDDRIKSLNPASIPCKIIQLYKNTYPNLDSLVIDDSYGTYLATKHLIENGHKRIMLIDYHLRIPLKRSDGFMMAIDKAGFSRENNKIVLAELGFDDYTDFIINEIKVNQPTAIITVTQQLGASAINAFRKMNKNLKDDISLIIYDDAPFAQLMNITTIGHPINDIADKLTKWLQFRLFSSDYTDEIQKMVIKPFINIRDSVLNLNMT